jgi:hypothetical protein
MTEELTIESRRCAGVSVVIIYSIKCTFWMLELSKDCPLIVKCDRKGVGVVVCGWCRTKDGSVVLDCVEFVGWDLDAGSCDGR